MNEALNRINKIVVGSINKWDDDGNHLKYLTQF